MKKLTILAAMVVLGLAACDTSPTQPTGVCHGQLVHHRVAMLLMETKDADCEPTGDANGSWVCEC